LIYDAFESVFRNVLWGRGTNKNLKSNREYRVPKEANILSIIKENIKYRAWGHDLLGSP